MEQIEGKNYLTILEVMERLNVCRQTVLRYRLSKKLDFIRLRGKIYITEESYKSLFIPVGSQGEIINTEELQKFIDEFSSKETEDINDRNFIYQLLQECKEGKKIYKDTKVITFDTCQIICKLISKKAHCSFEREKIKERIHNFITNKQESMDNVKTGEVILFCQDNGSNSLRLNIVIKLTLNDTSILKTEESFGSIYWSA